MDFAVSPSERSIEGLSDEASAMSVRYAYFFNHAVLWYIALSKDAGLTGRLVKPQGLKGGHHFFSGTHELPLAGLAARYGEDKGGFLDRAGALGARGLSFGDASVELLPLPRVPVTLILWLGDAEFEPRADLLLDSSCEVHLPLDIVWSIAMLGVLVML